MYYVMKPFLILQLRPEDALSDNEFEAFLKYGELESKDVHRIRMEKEGLPYLELDNYSGVIVGGGPSEISNSKKSKIQLRFEEPLFKLIREIVKRDFPFFGACYGIGALSFAMGGEVSKAKYSESAEATTISLNKNAEDDSLLNNLPKEFRAFGGHKESCQDVPKKAVLLASSKICPVHMIRFGKNVYATQFHPELDAEGLGLRILAYKNLGYFHPEEADKLIHSALQENVNVPMKILKAWVDRYKNQS